jgi:hypothetical protein
MSINAQEMTTGRTRDARAAKNAALPGLGWKLVNGFWISPHSGRRYDIIGARIIEELRNTYTRAQRRLYDQNRPPRPDRKPRGRPAKLQPA